MKGYSIYRDNTVIYEFVVDDTISKSLSGNKYVSFTISSKNDLDLKIGDYVLVGNEKYEIFEPIDIEESNGVFTYPLTFYFQGYKLNNSIITDEGATTFAYHGEVSDFMTLLIDSLNEDYPEFTLGTIQNGSILDLSFDNSNCMAALQTVCENAKMEWDITGTIITVKSRIGEETDHVFEYGRNKGSYSVKLAKVANASITTRMIGKGGTLNLPADYVSPDSPKRLNLGNEVLEKNVNKYGKITGVYINENIYPRLINKTVLGVTIPDNIEEAGSWKIKLDIPFNLSDYYADNEVPVVKFQTGDLTGLDFEIVKNSWNNTDKTLSIIVKEEEDGYYLPNANRQPRVGDVFVLLNINMPQSYIDEATQELREATQNELNKKCEPQYAPSLSVQKHYIKKKGILLNIGDGITVKIGGRNITTRIIGTTETSDDIRVELGDQMLYTYDTKVNNTIEQIQFTLKQLINIDDIKRLFYNLINAWYPKWFNQKLHKDADVEFNSVKAAELVQSDNFSSKNFTSGALGSGHRIKDGNAEFQNLTVRGQFSVFEFLIQQVKAIGGKFCVSPAAIKTVSVEETENGYKCFFNTDSGTIMNPFVVGDQAFHQVFDGQKMKRYWRLVTEVGADYFVLSKTDCEANSGIPEADEEIVLLGNRTDINRQSAIMISAYDNNSPYIAFYAGINSYSFEGKEPMRTGNLNGIVDEDFGQLTGFGLYCQNVYMKGVFRLMSGKTVEESIGDVQSNLDNLQVGGTNLLNGTTLDWVDATNASPLYYVDSVYLPQLRGKQITYSGLIKGINAQANTIGLETDITYTDESHVYENIFFGNRGNFEIQVQEHILILDKEIRNIRTYPIFRNGTVSGTIKVKQIQVEIGNKATTWKPSINDQKEIAKQQGIAGGQEAVDKVQIGSQNLISKKMMLKWNEKNKDIAVWGQDEDGIYLAVNQKLLYNSIAEGTEQKDIFNNAIQFKQNTQNVLSFEYKSGKKIIFPIISFRIYYTDGSFANVNLSGSNTTKTRTDYITDSGKTVDRISLNDSISNENALIYNISLIEGNKPLQGFPVAEEDQTGANNVNLADGTKEFTIGVGSTNYTYKELYVSKIKPNTVYYVNAGNIQNLVGNPDRYSFVLYNKDVSTVLCPTLNADKNGGFLITYNNFTEQEGRLLCYAGIAGSTLGNSVKFTEVMLVEGFLPAPVWTPSFSEQQAEIKTITETLTEIKAENGEISLRVNEVSERVEEAKQEAIDEAKEYTTIQTYRETDIDLRAEKWDQDTYYPVTIKLTDSETRIEIVTIWAASKPEWSTHESGFSMNCVWRSNGSGWGAFTVIRTIEVFEYRFTKEIPDTTPVQYILPAGSIGQLTSSSEELIYLRGGGRYLFKIGNNCVAVVHDSRYTAPDGTAVAPVTSVIRPVLTNVMKTEFDSQITQLKNSINLRVTKTDYDKNNQVLNQSIGNLQTSYNSISGTVSSLNTRLQTVEKAGYITTSQGNTLYASKKLENGNELISYINQDATNTTIKAKNINLNGAISANGNVQITTDGKLIAVNGQFTGKITATEGEIAGLKLSNNGLRSSDFNASSKVGSCYAKNGFSVYASESGVLAPSTGMLQAGIITATGTQASITGLEIIAKNTSGNATLSEITALKLRAIDYVDDSIKMAPTAALIVEEGVSIFRDAVEIAGKSTFRNKIYLDLASIPNISGASNYYLCINRSTGQLSYR
nr:MAG TPA: tail protein [Bacteriophage sp.]